MRVHLERGQAVLKAAALHVISQYDVEPLQLAHRNMSQVRGGSLTRSLPLRRIRIDTRTLSSCTI
ncbi:hypothetical protein CRUP_026205 [Coryphaenoides rupestris]|nr:hypothetical protein CRUP_026205 [Coryphaenoides rupestris]